MKNFLKSISLIASLLIILSIFFVCSNNEVPIDELKKLTNKQFGSPPSRSTVNPDTINIAVDISESMKGFVNTNSFQSLLQRTKTALGPIANVNYFAFDTSLFSVNNFLKFFDPNFYNGPGANFNYIFSLKQRDTNSILITVTDLQFNNNARYFDLVDLFQREIARGRYIKIFSAKPDFNGQIFPQFINKVKFKHNGQRPLYAIAIGERKHANFIEKVLRKGMPWDNSLTLSNKTPVDWKIFRSNKEITSPDEIKMDQRDSLHIKLRIVGPCIFEWRNWSKDEIQSELFSYKDPKFILENGNFEVRNILTTNDTCTITLFIKDINPSPHKLFCVFLRPNRVPDWISSQSCAPNGDQAKKTVKLEEFIKDIISPITNPFTITELQFFIND